MFQHWMEKIACRLLTNIPQHKIMLLKQSSKQQTKKYYI